MTAKNPRGPIRKPNTAGSHRNIPLRERRFYELDIVYLRQLRRLNHIVWNAKLKRDHALAKPVSSTLNSLRSSKDASAQSQKLR